MKKSELTAYSEDGQEVLPVLPSSFDAPIELKTKATTEEFLDNDWESVYQLVNADLAAAVGNKSIIFAGKCYIPNRIKKKEKWQNSNISATIIQFRLSFLDNFLVI